MKLLSKLGLIGITLLVGTTFAYAGCGIDKGSIRILANDFPALRAVVGEAVKCADDNITVAVNHATEHKNIQIAALTPNPAEYTSAIVSNSTVVPLHTAGLIRPMNNFVEKHGQGLKKSQLITIDGEVMAVAFMANSQHLVYREDILKAAGVKVPTTFEEVLVAAKVIREKNLMEHPYAGAYKAGWNLAEEFVNMYLGHGGEFFREGTAESNINSPEGIATLRMLKSLAEYSDPDYLTHDSEAIKDVWEAGNASMMMLWASRVPTLLDDEGSTTEIIAGTKLAGAPSVAGKSTPASTIWWDGFTIAKNISDEDAEATFRALVHAATSSDMANAHPDKAVWLISGFKPGPVSKGVLDNAKNGAKPYPMLPFMGLMHNALGAEIVEFLQGKETAEKALADVNAAYITAAKEAGFLK